MTEPFDPITDAWRSVWEAIATRNGDDPDKAIDGHKMLCKLMGYSEDSTPTINSHSEDI